MAEKLPSEALKFLDKHGNLIAQLTLYPPEKPANALLRLSEAEARKEGEEPVQILEGVRYEYEFDVDNLRLEEEYGNGAVVRSANPNLVHCGSIIPGLRTGRLGLVARSKETGEIVGHAALEVRSRKVSYRKDYRRMLEEITNQCVDLLMDLHAPTTMIATPDPGRTSDILHQQFAFLRALIGSRYFGDALHRITTHPHQRWEPEETACNTRRGFRPDSRTLRQLARVPGRMTLSGNHPLAKTITSLPERISLYRNVQTNDTLENRFVKFALQNFSAFLNKMQHALEEMDGAANARLYAEIAALKNRLETALAADVFRNVPHPDMLPLGSPVLQRKGGYREIYQAWLKFNMAASLEWVSIKEFYSIGQRNIAALYEYWVFFKLLNIISSVFDLEEPAAHTLFEKTKNGFGLKLKSGEHLAFEGALSKERRPLKVRFSYNRTFSRNSERGTSGSWTETMRPDYTLSLWPAAFEECEAEEQELTVHVHFDAKYRIESVDQLFGRDDIDLNAEKREQREGRYKRADLLKMHAYRDAIRRTQGAYILYPGDTTKQWRGFHEILPGLGAFPMKPGDGEQEIANFVREIIAHACDRATARERQSYHVYKVQKAPSAHSVMNVFFERVTAAHTRHPPPAETLVLVGQFENQTHLSWILGKKSYDIPIDINTSRLRLDPEIASAEYLLLCCEDSGATGKLLKITSKGPYLISKEILSHKNYPGDTKGNLYLVFDVESVSEFDKFSWDYTELLKISEGAQSVYPFVVTFDALMAIASSNLSKG